MWGFWFGVAVAGEDPVLDALATEVDRTMTAWVGAEHAPYYLAYRAVDSRSSHTVARYGVLAASSEDDRRELDVAVRVGSPARDSTHRLKGEYVSGLDWHVGQSLPLEPDPLALRVAVWNATSKEIASARETWQRVVANTTVKVADEDPSPDFAPEPSVVDLGPHGGLAFDRSAWEPILSALSARLDAHPDVHASSATLDAVVQTRYFVDSAGTRVREPHQWIRVALNASTTADDGAQLRLYRWRDVADPGDLPDQVTLLAWADDLRRDLVELRAAPSGEAYSGPVLLRGKAAGVFMHEVLGHRVEGHRQKDDEEGQTFKDKVGQQVLPAFLDVWDDPSVEVYGGEHLNGHYRYDDEGVPARRATIVEDGVFRGFLMSRSPIEGFATSNGHGRAQVWNEPVARMANLVVETAAPVPAAELRAKLLAEVKAQGRPFGLLVDEIDGGFTLTGRTFPNAFNVRAVTAWKVFADGRPDERVRTIDLVGTPLVALANVAAAGDDPGVFNGFCGAESGAVPVSAVSPSLLLRTLEVQKKEKGAERPPLLPKPGPAGDS
jgi:predicted Zn-dependent protease